MEEELLGSDTCSVRPCVPRLVPLLAVAHGPNATPPHHHRNQFDRTALVGDGHHEGQREEEHPRSADAAERDHGVDAHGHHLHPPQLRPRRRDQQHLQRQEAPQRRRLRRPRRVHGLPQIRHPPPRLPLRLPLLLPLHQVHQPGQLPHQRPSHRRCRQRRVRAAAVRDVPGVHLWPPGEGLRAEHHRQQAVLRRAPAPAVDIWARPRVPVVRHHGAHTVQPRRGVRGGERWWRRQLMCQGGGDGRELLHGSLRGGMHDM